MPIARDVDHPRRLTTTNVTGAITLAEIREHVAAQRAQQILGAGQTSATLESPVSLLPYPYHCFFVLTDSSRGVSFRSVATVQEQVLQAALSGGSSS